MKERLKKVTLSEAKKNPQYWDVVKPMFKQQIVRTIQHNFRTRHNKTYHGDFQELTRMGTKGLHFILEVESKENDIKIEEHVQKIKAGEWETLNLDDTNFIRNLYKALRLSKITTNEMATALLLHGTRIEMRDEKLNETGIRTTHPADIKKYSFDDKSGPYQPEKISYALPHQLTAFKNSLATLPKSEQFYFSLNFSHKRAVAFLYDGLNKGLYGEDKFREILTKYINRYEIKSGEEQEKWGIKALNENKLDAASAQKIIAFIEAKESPRIMNFVKRKHVYLTWETLAQTGRYTDYFKEYKVSTTDQKEIEAFIKSGDYLRAGVKLDTYIPKKELAGVDLCEKFIQEWYLTAAVKDDFIKSINQYVLNFETDGNRIKILTKLIDDLKNTNEKVAIKSAKKLKEYIKAGLSTYCLDYIDQLAIQRRDRQSAELLINILAVNEQDPWVEISPDYKPNDTNSPLLCEVIPTVSAFAVLQSAMHGADTTNPAFVAGQLTPRIIRSYDEKTEDDLKVQSRPVELTHPDLLPTSNVHGASPPHDSLLTRHDLFHCWRNGAEKYKPFIRYLRKLLENEKEFDMSKSLWELSDMDLSGGRLIRDAEKLYEECKQTHNFNIIQKMEKILLVYKSGHLDRLLLLAGRQIKDKRAFYDSLDACDDNLLLIVDMIVHQQQWKKFLGDAPQTLLVPGVGLKHYSENYKRFQDVYSKMERIAGPHASYGQFQENIFYILAYRLQSRPDCLQLCDHLKTMDLKNILHWERNSGLYFYPDFGFKNRIVEKLNPEELSSQLSDIVNAVEKYSTLSTKQSKIFCILAYRLKDHSKANEIRELLEKIDLTKIFKFRSTDRKLYLRDPETGLLTNNALPTNPDELYSLLKQAMKQASLLERKEAKTVAVSSPRTNTTFFDPLSTISHEIKEEKKNIERKTNKI